LISVNVATRVVPPAGIVIWQAPAPVQGADHASVESACGIPETVTTVPCGMAAEQFAPQFKLPPPGHVAVTVPAPLPCRETTKLAFLTANVALTCCGAAIEETMQVVPVTLEQPDQLWKTESAPATA